ncbi:MAG: indolepyruvate ferredoxin oxidoreductase family protein, partial [Alphaproteobacteria bacterium]|nr:indolepyruvate ferredoxin oxidoreductase family protein [Alphaproteobacteria bacterium]
TLDDKYTLESGRVYITGIQALVRLPLMQRQRDLSQGLNTAGYISGYRGSPVAAYDQQLWQARKFLEANHIRFQPGLNEDMAATAVWGSQHLHLGPDAKYDGVFGIWYAKGPGVDRSGDVLRHANVTGTGPHGGVLAVLGDDHDAVSSTIPNQSEHLAESWMTPILHPANVQEYLDYGILGWAMSRYSGCWVGFKCITEIVESAASVSVDPHRVEIVIPDDFELPEGGLNARWPEDRWQQEVRLKRDKIYAAKAFARANGIDRTVIDSPQPRFGIIATGKAYLDVRQALDDLGIDDAMAAEIGLRVYKVGMPWPLGRVGARRFAEGLEEVLVVEEKRAFIENQLKEQLYNWRADVRPTVVGKFDENGVELLPSHGELSPAMVARVIVERLKGRVSSVPMQERMAVLERKARQNREPPPTVRMPYFCSGCPHNTSTRVPDGSRAIAGIGCHFMAVWMDRNTQFYPAMGGEGVQWMGLAPFTNEPHMFANLGDGTYYHSGLMAVRAAVAADVNLTFKILFNDAVAMTGGQPHDGPLSPWQISQQVHHEGVARVVVVTDEPDKYPVGTDWAPGVTVHHRDELDRVQRQLRETPGVTVLIYDQTCAAEKRRRRRRGTFPDPDRRVFINDLVCEGCGDCSVMSNCVSVEPLETEWGRKRQINQSACNKDFSCLKGFCPSFVTVKGAALRKAESREDDGLAAAAAGLPEPAPEEIDKPYNIIVTGIGGTGVITIGQLLGMAAHLEGKGASVLDFTGLAQKNGEVLSHIRVAPDPDDIHSPRVADGNLDLLLGCDLVTAAGTEAMKTVERGQTHAIVNSHLSPTAAFTLNPDMDFQGKRLQEIVREGAGDNLSEFVAASELATALAGDAIATNVFMLGYAYQRGTIPIAGEALLKAIELNGVAVEANKRTFGLGRLAAHDITVVERAAGPAATAKPDVAEDLEAIIEKRAAYLTEYQDAAYATRYLGHVRRVAAAEAERAKGRSGLTEAVARYLFKLMAYKDEYEVARLYTSGDFEAALRRQFDGELKLSFHLAPPLLSRPDPETGEIAKREYGPWIIPVLKWLAKMRRLRGTAWDPFGRTAERRQERQLIVDYEAMLDEILASLDTENHALAVEIARLPAEIRGFGHVKEQHLQSVRAREAELKAAFRDPSPQATAAE